MQPVTSLAQHRRFIYLCMLLTEASSVAPPRRALWLWRLPTAFKTSTDRASSIPFPFPFPFPTFYLTSKHFIQPKRFIFFPSFYTRHSWTPAGATTTTATTAAAATAATATAAATAAAASL